MGRHPYTPSSPLTRMTIICCGQQNFSPLGTVWHRLGCPSGSAGEGAADSRAAAIAETPASVARAARNLSAITSV